VWLEERRVAYVLATRVNDTAITINWADALIAALPRQVWKRLSGGQGSHGERIYDWARVAVRPVWENGFGHWVLARRSRQHDREGRARMSSCPTLPVSCQLLDQYTLRAEELCTPEHLPSLLDAVRTLSDSLG
jgi:hypothetical protein